MLNAGGRLTTPLQSLATLLASSFDSYAKIQELIAVNELRKEKSRDAFERAINTVDSSQPILIFIDEHLEHGILGLVAAKLTEMYHKPSAVFTLHDGQYVGSLRAPIGIDLVQILDHASSYLHRYGGHAGAAGCTILEQSMDDAKKALSDAMRILYDGHDATPIVRVDTVLDPARISFQTLKSLESLRPFGV
jgi:single-stranded-DNA-specific exonuclease